MEKKYLMTRNGYSKVSKELDFLITQERPRVIESIRESRSYGGELSENAEYLEAKERQESLEKKISGLKEKLEQTKVIDIDQIADDGVVRFGSIVSLLDLETDEEVTYQIVGEEEADIKHSKISYTSPIAAAMMGKKIDDVIYFRIPKGDRELEILDIRTNKSNR